MAAMIYRFPNYYKEFSCIADKCEATCCAGWQIVVDEESLKKYKKVSGEFKKRINEGVDFKEGVFFQNPGKRCAFLNEHNLCDMYTALGEEAFCETCRRYPRHIEEFENIREFTLSASCPEAARILLSQREPAGFYEEVSETEEEVFDEYDPLVYEKLYEARGEMLKVLQNRNIPVTERATALWDFIEVFQEKMDEGTLFSQEDIYELLIPRNPDTSYEEALALFSLIYHLEVLAEDWEETLTETKQLLFGAGEAEYLAKQAAFEAWCRVNLPDWEIYLEQLLVYFITTYFCGAVYDEYVASKVKMSVCSVFYIKEMARAQWLKQKESLTVQDISRIVYRYSRELEHSDENLCLMDRIMEEI